MSINVWKKRHHKWNIKVKGATKYAENHNALQEPYHVTVFWKYYLFVKLAYFVNSYVKLTAGWSFRIVYQPALSQTIAPNAFTWFLKELLTTLWRLWKAFSSKTILLGLHMISVFILSAFYWQCIFNSIVDFRNIYHPLLKWFASQQPL